MRCEYLHALIRRPGFIPSSSRASERPISLRLAGSRKDDERVLDNLCTHEYRTRETVLTPWRAAARARVVGAACYRRHRRRCAPAGACRARARRSSTGCNPAGAPVHQDASRREGQHRGARGRCGIVDLSFRSRVQAVPTRDAARIRDPVSDQAGHGAACPHRPCALASRRRGGFFGSKPLRAPLPRTRWYMPERLSLVGTPRMGAMITDLVRAVFSNLPDLIR